MEHACDIRAHAKVKAYLQHSLWYQKNLYRTHTGILLSFALPLHEDQSFRMRFVVKVIYPSQDFSFYKPQLKCYIISHYHTL